ncbi:MAG: hypothetical protein HRU31_09525, partial [Rhodobacteraceae bacterium]|nr:hypothetical protein [Paracoccaceae bacterium]
YAIDKTSVASPRSGALPRQSLRLVPVELQPAEASIQSLRASLVAQPLLILQFAGQSIPVGGTLSGGLLQQSLLGQRDPNWRCVVMCHKTPDGCPEDERIEICEMECPVPAERAGFYKDKSAKLAAGMQKALERDPRFCMLLDADDRVHADLVGYMAQQQDLLHIVDKGISKTAPLSSGRIWTMSTRFAAA